MNIYVQMIQDVCLGNKYTRWYCNIISKRLQQFSSRKEANKALGYSEGHHIVPRAFKMGGVKDKINIVYLTAREHFLVHMLLVKMVDCSLKYRMSSALNILRKESLNSKTFETARRLNSENNISKLQDIKDKKRKTCLNNYGVDHALQSAEIYDEMKRANLEKYGVEYTLQLQEVKDKGKITSLERYGTTHHLQNDDQKEKVKISNLERYGFENVNQVPEIRNKANKTCSDRYGGNSPICSPEVREKSKKTWLKKYGVDNPGKIKYTCPHCLKEGKGPNMKRYHFDNCKHKDTTTVFD